MALSAEEQRLLAGIEDQLGRTDPRLVAASARTRPRWPRWFPLSPVHVGALVLALVVLIIAQPFVAQFGPIWSGLLTASLVVPWMVSAARTRTGKPIARRRKRHGRGGLPAKAPT